MKRIKKISPLSLAKVSGVTSGILYLVLVLIVIFLGSIFFNDSNLNRFDFLGFGSTVVATVLFALVVAGVNFIIGLIIGWLYNLTISLTGGLAVELEDKEDYGEMFESPARSQTGKEDSFKEEATEIHTMSKDVAAQKEVNKLIGNSFPNNDKRDTFSIN